MDDTLGYFLLYLFISVLVGGLIGNWRHRVAFGIILSLLLGPIGWLITALMPAQNKIESAPPPGME